MTNFSKEARAKIYEEERARLAEQKRQEEEAAAANLSPEARLAIYEQEKFGRQGTTFLKVALPIVVVCAVYYFGLEFWHSRLDDRQAAFVDARRAMAGDDLEKMLADKRSPAIEREIEGLRQWMPWRW